MAAPNFADKTLWTGDNLDILRGMNSESVDLIYLDPPFNSNQNYAAPVGSKAAGAAFKDTWSLSDLDVAWMGLIADEQPAIANLLHTASLTHGKGMQSYLTMMAVRLLEMRRVLKDTGNIYLHCDPTASHYLKLLMDSVFGSGNFRNEIIWRRGTGVSRTVAKRFLRNHDTLLCYSNGATWTYSRQFKPYSKATLAMFKHDDKDGRGSYRLQELRTYGKETRSRLRGENRIIESKTGREYLKQYLQEKPGNTVDSIWEDVGTMNTQGSPERIGYPTQKPLALLERIIKASSNEGDVVLDPFCGCATGLCRRRQAGPSLGRH